MKMNKNLFYNNYYNEIKTHLDSVSFSDLDNIKNLISAVSKNKKKIICVGNGGSAAMASHISVDITKTTGVRAINFNEADLLTCFSNDYGYENWVLKAFEFFADEGDMAILISSSGQSENIINGAIKAKEMKISVLTLSGFQNDNPLRSLGDINLWVNCNKYNVVEMVHHIWLLSIIDYIVLNLND